MTTAVLTDKKVFSRKIPSSGKVLKVKEGEEGKQYALGKKFIYFGSINYSPMKRPIN